MAGARFLGGAQPLSDEELFAPRPPRPVAPQAPGVEGQDWYRYLLGKLAEEPAKAPQQPAPYTWSEAAAKFGSRAPDAEVSEEAGDVARVAGLTEDPQAAAIRERSRAAYAARQAAEAQQEAAARQAAQDKALSFGSYKGAPYQAPDERKPTPPQPFPGANGTTGFPGADEAEKRKTAGAQLLTSSLQGLFRPPVPSDERVKERVANAPPAQQDAATRSLSGYTFDYKPEMVAAGAPSDRRVGVMAQDVESTPLGREVVRETPMGKALDRDNALGMALGLLGRLGERIDKLERKK